MGNIQKGMQQSNQPLYGQAQQANYLNNLNNLANTSIQSLQSQLARTGGVNSGAMASGATQIGLGRMGQQANYLANVPLMNRQAQLQGAQTYGGLGNQLMGVAPKTDFTSGNQFQQGTQTGYQKQTYDPSIMSDIGQAVGIAGAAFGMPAIGGMMGGGAPPGMGAAAGNSAFGSWNSPSWQAALNPSGGQSDIPGFGPGGLQPNNLMWNSPQNPMYGMGMQ